MWMNRSGVLSLIPQNLNWIIWGSFWTSQLRHMVEPYLVPQNVHSLTIVLLIRVYFQGYLIICCIDCFGMTDFWRINVCQHEIYWALGLLKMKETPRVAAALIPHYARFSRSCKIRIECCDPFLKSIVGSSLYVPPVRISRYSTHLGRISSQKKSEKTRYWLKTRDFLRKFVAYGNRKGPNELYWELSIFPSTVSEDACGFLQRILICIDFMTK